MARVHAYIIAAAAGAAAFLTAGAACASITIMSGSFGSSGGVHSTPGLDASTVTGTVGPHGDLVTLMTTGETDKIKTSGGGESDFDGDTDLDNLEIDFSKSYAKVTFNIIALKKTNSTMMLSVDDGLATFTEAISGHGENKFVVTATGGDSIDELNFTFSPEVADIRQIRVEPLVTPIPEPAAWALMLVGLALLGARLRHRGLSDLAAA